MKKLIAVVTSMGTLMVGLSAQIDFTPVKQSPNASFNELVAAMANDGGSLSQAGHPNPLYSEFTFEYQIGGGATTGNFETDGTLPVGPPNVTLQFSKIDNFPAFLVQGQPFDIGFIAFDAAATNSVGIVKWPGFGNKTEVFQYRQNNPPAGFDSPPSTARFTTGPKPDAFSFFAEVDFGNHPFGPHYQSDANYWRIFQQTNQESNAPSIFILALEDLGTGGDRDFDDGFFVLSGFVTPIPEPSVIGLGAVVGLIGFIAYRRRRSNRK